MTWFAWKGYANGKAVDIAGSQEKEAVVLGFHGYATEGEAESKPNSVAAWYLPQHIPQVAFINAIIADYNFAKRAGEQPGGPHATLTPGNIVAGSGQAAASYVPGIQQVGQFFNDLTNPHMWLRIAEGVLAVLLIATAVSKLAGNTGAGKAARKIPLVV